MGNYFAQTLVFVFVCVLSITNGAFVEISENSSPGEIVYLGSFIQQINPKSRSTNPVDFEEHHYFIGPGVTSHSDAAYQCRNFFDKNSTLLSIETEDEWAYIKTLLEPRSSGAFYMSALQDGQGKLRWINGIEVANWAPWGTGYPNPINSQTRVTLNYQNPLNSDWRTVYGTTLQNYICEMPTTTIAIPCYQTNDLVIVLDSSGSIGSTNYLVAKQFVERLALAFATHAESRLSFIIYSDSWNVIIALDSNLIPPQKQTAILNAPYLGQTTSTDLAIDAAVNELNSHSRGVPQNMVVLTDGISNNPMLTMDSAGRATAMGIRTFAVGITDNVNQAELLYIAGGNSSHVFTTATFDKLIELLTPVSVRVCPN